MTSFRTDIERQAEARLADLFDSSPRDTSVKLQNILPFLRRQDVKRILALYEVFKLALPVKGSVIDCGVFHGESLMAWGHFSAILEPENLTRRVYGFDSFAGLTSLSERDRSARSAATEGALQSDAYDDLREAISIFDSNRFIGQIDKLHIYPGDATDTIPQFVADNPHLIVSLLYLDFDVYEPTRVALETLVPRMPKGAVIAFDELDNPIWPGETLALLDTLGIGRLRLQRLPWDPYIAYAVIE